MMETDVKPQIVKEMMYTVPLKYAWCGPHNDRTRKAVTILKKFLIKHMKSENVHLTEELNEELWKHGMKNPPRRIKIRAVLLSTGEIWATLPESKFPFEKKKEEEKIEKKEREKEEKEQEQGKKEEIKEEKGKKEKEPKQKEETEQSEAERKEEDTEKKEEVNKKEE